MLCMHFTSLPVNFEECLLNFITLPKSLLGNNQEEHSGMLGDLLLTKALCQKMYTCGFQIFQNHALLNNQISIPLSCGFNQCH